MEWRNSSYSGGECRTREGGREGGRAGKRMGRRAGGREGGREGGTYDIDLLEDGQVVHRENVPSPASRHGKSRGTSSRPGPEGGREGGDEWVVVQVAEGA